MAAETSLLEKLDLWKQFKSKAEGNGFSTHDALVRDAALSRAWFRRRHAGNEMTGAMTIHNDVRVLPLRYRLFLR